MTGRVGPRLANRRKLQEYGEFLEYLDDHYIDQLGCNCGIERDGSPRDCLGCQMRSEVEGFRDWMRRD